MGVTLASGSEVKDAPIEAPPELSADLVEWMLRAAVPKITCACGHVDFGYALTQCSGCGLRFLPEESPVSAIKHDGGKATWHLLPTEAVEQVVRVLENGAKKYAPHNWRKGMEWTRCYDAAMRHLAAWQQGEDLNPDSNLNHLAHAACNLLFLLSYAQTNIGTDDRYKGQP